MFTKRQLKILDLIVKNSNGITGAMIADSLNVSSRTIRNDISAINEILKNKKVRINSSNKKGYFLDTDQVKCIKEMIHLVDMRKSHYVESDDRILSILGKVLFYGKQSFYDLADMLYISEQMVYKECNKLKKILQMQYHENGIKIAKDYIENESSEEQIRKLLFKLLKDFVSANKTKYITKMEHLLCGYFTEAHFEQLYQVVKDFFDIHQINIDDQSMDMIVGSLYICILRNECGFFVNESEVLRSSSIADLLIDKLKNDGFHISEYDKSCLYDFLWCIKISDKILDGEGISNIVFCIINEFCTDVMEKYNFDLRESKDIMDDLTIHIEYMLRRLDMGYELENPMIDDIKRKYPLACEIAMLIVHTIYKYKKNILWMMRFHILRYM